MVNNQAQEVEEGTAMKVKQKDQQKCNQKSGRSITIYGWMHLCEQQ